jgi:hypothetical protein
VWEIYHCAESIDAVKVVVTGGVNELLFLQELIRKASDNPNAIVRVTYLN